MENLFSTEALLSLIPLTLMEILLGIDNVIFVSIVLSRLERSQVKKASLIWMLMGIGMRLLFLFLLGYLLKGEHILFTMFEHPVELKDIIMLAGGLFLLVNSTLEIHNKLEGEDPDEKLKAENKKPATFKAIIIQIILIDMVFSIDGIVTAIGMANNFVIMMTAVQFFQVQRRIHHQQKSQSQAMLIMVLKVRALPMKIALVARVTARA